MESSEVKVALDDKDLLGEGPVWDPIDEILLRVDILRHKVHAWNPVTGARKTTRTSDDVGAVVLCDEFGAHVLAVGHQLVLRQDGHDDVALSTVETHLPANRFNDCRCDPQGRLWAGTMSTERVPGAAGLYRLDPGHDIELVIWGTTISNGLGWSPAGDLMYFIDSPAQRIDVLDFDGPTGDVANRRVFIEIDPEDGMPDGLTVDSEGCVWVCLFGGAAVRRYAPDGHLLADIPLPVTYPTCPTFGGADLETLFITSTRHRQTDEELRREPHAGAVLSLPAPVAGIPVARFALTRHVARA